MKCHDILGVKECANSADIGSAYNQKISALIAQKGSIDENAYEKKYAEIRKAKDDCRLWLDSAPIERLKIRTKAIIKCQPQSKRLYSTIGCCTCCNDNCGNGNESCCNSFCCGECQSLPRICDIFLWIALGAFLGFFLLRAIFRALAKAMRNNRQSAYNKAAQALPSLRTEALRIKTQLQHSSEERKLRQQRERELNAFADFFESLGTASTNTLRVTEHERVVKQDASEASLQSAYDRIIREIKKAERVIRRGQP